MPKPITVVCFFTAFLLFVSTAWDIIYTLDLSDHNANTVPKEAWFKNCSAEGHILETTEESTHITASHVAKTFNHPCNAKLILVEFKFHVEHGWQLYMNEMMRCCAYVLFIPCVLVINEHYGVVKNEEQLVVMSCFGVGIIIRIIKTLEQMSASSYITRHHLSYYTDETLRTLWLQTQEMDNGFWGSIPVTCFSLSIAFGLHSLAVIQGKHTMSGLGTHGPHAYVGACITFMLIMCMFFGHALQNLIMGTQIIIHMILLPLWLVFLGIGLEGSPSLEELQDPNSLAKHRLVSKDAAAGGKEDQDDEDQDDQDDEDQDTDDTENPTAA